jgi:PTH1 family peptidyl-tRNA hydrolase
MNRSGRAARSLLEELGRPELSRVLVVTDDLDLPLGKIRFRRSGGDGGHNGLRSLIEELESRDFPRLRLGIGRPPTDDRPDVVDWVLQPFEAGEGPVVTEVVERAVEAVQVFVTDGVEVAMNRYNAGGLATSDGPPDPTGE